MTQDFQVRLSMNQAAVVKSGLVLKQGDFGMNLEIEVLNFDTSNTTPQIVFRKPMGAVESTSVTKSGNVYTYTLRGTELDTPGKVICDLKLKNSTTQRISTASFMFEVVADTLDGLAEESSSYSDTIAQIIDGYEEELTEIEDDINTFKNEVEADIESYKGVPEELYDFNKDEAENKLNYIIGHASENVYNPTTATLISRNEVSTLTASGISYDNSSFMRNDVVNIVIPVTGGKNYKYKGTTKANLINWGIKYATAIPEEWSNQGFSKIYDLHPTVETLYIILFYQIDNYDKNVIQFSIDELPEKTIDGKINDIDSQLSNINNIKQLIAKTSAFTWHENYKWKSDGGEQYDAAFSTAKMQLKAGTYIVNARFDYTFTYDGENVSPLDINNVKDIYTDNGVSYMVYEFANDCTFLPTFSNSLYPIVAQYDGRIRIEKNYALNEIIASNFVKKPLSENSYTIIFAASNSSEEAKKSANYICDGVNDRAIIQNAINNVHGKTARFFFKNGTYIINDLSLQGNTYCGILIPQTKTSLSFEGENQAWWDAGSANPSYIDNGVIFKLTSAAITGIDTTKQISVFVDNSGTYPRNFITMKNISVLVPSNQINIVAIDLANASGICLEQCWVFVDVQVEHLPVPYLGSCGIRCPNGSQIAEYYLRNCVVCGFDRGFSIGGEHIIAIGLSAIYCNYSYYLAVSGGVYHSNVFINCNEEFCIRSIYIDSAASNGVWYEFIGHDIEVHFDSSHFSHIAGAIEATPGNARGIVTYCVTEGGVGSTSYRFWENGSGGQFETRQSYNKIIGTTSERPVDVSVNTQYFDTTLNKMIVYNGTGWVDFMGNNV